MAYRTPGSSVHGILQARILEGVAMPSSRGSSRPGIEPESLMSPALAGRFLTTYTSTPLHTHRGSCKWEVFGKKYRHLDWGGVCDGRTGAPHPSPRGQLLVSFHFLEHRCSPVLQDHIADRHKRIKFWMNPDFHLLIISWGVLFLLQFSSVAQLCWLFVTPWTAAHQASLSHQHSELAQTHVHWVGDAIQPSHRLFLF